MTEIALHQGNDIAAQMQWAQAVCARSDGAAQSIIPESYRNNPANVLIAVGLGQSMGLSFAESLYRIAVIKGKPSAAAELIASNVRKAGHKLRVRVTEDPPSATCTIIRADDPDEPTVITRDMAWAQRMGLATTENYKKQPSTMLSWRAISACARLACPEALYGVAYTPDELGDTEPTAAPVKRTGMDALRGALQAEAAEAGRPIDDATADSVVRGLEQSAAGLIVDADEVTDEPEPKLTARQRGRLFALFAQKGIPEADQLAGIAHVIGRPVEHRDALTEAEFDAVIAQLETLADVEAS